jgi:isopenicillin-N N-acyltransferase-like protein
MRKLNKWLRYLIYFLLGFVGLVLIFMVYMVSVALVSDPKPKDLSSMKLQRKQLDANCYVIGQNWLRKSNSGLWEMYVEGAPFERGVINGKLARELVFEQEDAFNDQICSLVPSAFYRSFLKYFIAWFNRDLEKNLTEEQKLEIFGVSRSAASKFDYIGSPYQRMMNYHAAHDIGHALENLAMVGCSSFATWNERSKDSLLIVGRNFDFYVGDKFAENKIIEFCKPTTGYRFMMVTWGGMTGVLSGMNMEGVTVTINSAKSTLPPGSATPISLLSREILQYSKNIDDAIRIAKKRRTFVSESILISSAADNRAIIIEKTPDTMGVYAPPGNEIICANHYQSEGFSQDPTNLSQKAQSASVYRFNRIRELMRQIDKNTVEQTAALLRDQKGLKGANIGYGNEKAVNQLICHHSIIFEPQKKLVWLSTSPWQLGKFVAYDLNKIFAMKGLNNTKEIYDSLKNIDADPFLKTPEFHNFIQFRKIKAQITAGKEVDLNQLIQSNPDYYDTYAIAGDYQFKRKKYAEAKAFYKTALTKEIATKTEENHIRKQLNLCLENIKKGER